MKALVLIDQADHAKVMLDPVRLKILEQLATPDSAANVARALELPRQRVGYHIRELERHGLVRTVSERKKGNTVERLVQATASHYLIAPQVLGKLGADPTQIRDRFSSTYLVALAARTIREVSTLRKKAESSEKKLPTFTAHHDVRFGSQEAQNAYAQELGECMASLGHKYHDDEAVGGRSFRFLALGYPTPSSPSTQGVST